MLAGLAPRVLQPDAYVVGIRVYTQFQRLWCQFVRDARGTMTIFGLTLVFLTALLGGLAVDVMRFESRRSQVQAGLDVCVLNAASLRQTVNQSTLFNDCIRKSGLTGLTTSLKTTSGTSSRQVSASASETLKPFFLGMLGIDRLKLNATATAQERASNTEVSLVLDVSGSMYGSRISALKVAAKDFVNTLLSRDDRSRVSIGIVPYSGTVNLGPDLAAKFNMANVPVRFSVPEVNQSRCIDLPDSAITTSISRTDPFRATIFADHFAPTQRDNIFVPWTDADRAVPIAGQVPCLNVAGNQVRLPDFSTGSTSAAPITPAQRIAALNARIDGLSASGSTSIHLGLRWGLALLDPAMQSVFSEFALAGRMPSAFANRPLRFDDADTMKIVILMTDGENTSTYQMRPEYQDGLSPIWRGNDGNYSVMHTSARGRSTFFVPHLGTSRTTAWRNATNTGAPAVQISWQEVWQRWRVEYVAWQFYARALATNRTAQRTIFNNMLNSFRTITSASTMDSQLQVLCRAARDRNVVVYSIAFEAPSAGQTQLRQCASTESRYYEANRTNLSQVFGSIAGNISKLRLTQ